MTPPRFITFTGADEYTSIDGMRELSAKYRVEWGILFSPKRQGTGRYPPLEFVTRVAQQASRLDLSAHLCGGYARDVMAYQNTALDGLLDFRFQRAQINTGDPAAAPEAIRAWANRLGLSAIMQCRGDFPTTTEVQWLLDASGGRGIEPKAWPIPRSTFHASALLKGYAGGLNPSNVADHVEKIGMRDQCYWIDMETGVRDANDRFSLELCRQVCEAVYG